MHLAFFFFFLHFILLDNSESQNHQKEHLSLEEC